MNYKTLLIIFLLVFIWGSFFFVIVRYGEDIRKHPCSVCAERAGESVICYLSSGVSREWFINGSYKDIGIRQVTKDNSLDEFLKEMKNDTGKIN